ncbi:DNA-binding pseudobarrel domain-containing protein [Tanacetum coccineum]
MNFNKGDGASFFKILLRDSEDYFPLPTAFANKYLEKWNNKKQTIILKTKSVETDIFSQEEQKKWSRNTAVEAAKSFKSDYPHYKVTIKDSYNRSKKLHVPMWFFRRYLSSNEECVKCVLKVANGKKWGPIKCRGYNKYSYGRMYGDKLKKFCDENHLVVGDACVFELINKVKHVYKLLSFGLAKMIQETGCSDADVLVFDVVENLSMVAQTLPVDSALHMKGQDGYQEFIGDGAEGTLEAIDLGVTGPVTTAELTVVAVGATVAGGVAVKKGIEKYVPTTELMNVGGFQDFYKISFKNLFKSKVFVLESDATGDINVVQPCSGHLFVQSLLPPTSATAYYRGLDL